MTRSVRASACQGRVALLLAALIAAAMVSHASAHGYLLKPAPRNVLATGRFGFYGPMSLNRCGSCCFLSPSLLCNGGMSGQVSMVEGS